MTIQRTRTLAATTLVAAGSLLLAACGGSPSSPAADGPGSSGVISTSPTHSATPSATAAAKPAGRTSPAAPRGAALACSLVTEQQARTALGADPGPGQEIAPGHCIYGAKASSINIVEQALPGSRAGFDGLRAAMAGTAVDVAGVGDAAFGRFSGPMAVIEFYKGNTLVTLSLDLGGATTLLKDRAITLAKKAASRL
jgi:hypothetical protein